MNLKEAASLVLDNYLYESHDSSLMGHMDLKDLPRGVQNHIIQTLGLRPKNVPVHVSTEVQPYDSYGAGHRAHFAIVHNAGEKPAKMIHSSWGGPNPFQTTALDALNRTERSYPIPPGHAVVLGSSQNRVSQVHFHPDDIAKLLPASNGLDLADEHLIALQAYKTLKSGPYRKGALQRGGVKPKHIDALVSGGLLSRNKAGAHTITTNGKNALHTMKDRVEGIKGYL